MTAPRTTTFGRPHHEGATVGVPLRLTIGELDAINAQAAKERLPRGVVIRAAIAAYLSANTDDTSPK